MCMYIHVNLQDKERIYVDLFDEDKREKDKLNAKIITLRLIIPTSLSIIQWNLSKYFTINEHHLWWDKQWQNISSEEKIATKLLKQWFEVAEQVNDNNLMQDEIATG